MLEQPRQSTSVAWFLRTRVVSGSSIDFKFKTTNLASLMMVCQTISLFEAGGGSVLSNLMSATVSFTGVPCSF
jgi:hypothetical protein